MNEQEEWRPVVGHPGYEVSNLGRVVSLKRRTPRLLKAPLGTRGYRQVEFWDSGVRTHRTIHGLVAQMFLGPRPDGLQVRHLDGDPMNNRLSNLAYGTREQNAADSLRHGTNYNAAKTECVNGHSFTPENTYLAKPYKGGDGLPRRQCRTCLRASQRRSQERRAFAAANIQTTEVAA